MKVRSIGEIVLELTPLLSPIRHVSRRLRRAKVKKVEELSPLSKRVLWIDEYDPVGRADAGSIRALHVIENLLSRGYSVSIVAPDSRMRIPGENRHIPGVSRFQTICDYREASKSFGMPSFIWVSRLYVLKDNAKLLKANFRNVPIVWDSVDMLSRRLSTEAMRLNSILLKYASRYVRRQEFRAAEYSNLNVVVSQIEADYIKHVSKVEPIVLPTIHVLSDLNENEKRTGIVFVGNFAHTPNASGLEWFINKVWPLIPDSIRNQRLKVVGANPPKPLLDKKLPDVDFVGYVKELRSTIENSKINIAPLLSGAGVKGKISEALSLGVPTVTTSVGAEGMHLMNGSNSFIADNERDFASAIEKLFSDKKLYKDMSSEAHSTAAKFFSIQTLTNQVDEILKHLV